MSFPDVEFILQLVIENLNFVHKHMKINDHSEFAILGMLDSPSKAK